MALGYSKATHPLRYGGAANILKYMHEDTHSVAQHYSTLKSNKAACKPIFFCFVFFYSLVLLKTEFHKSRKDLLLAFNYFNKSDREIFKLACALCYLTISFSEALKRQHECFRDEIIIKTVSVTQNSTTQT